MVYSAKANIEFCNDKLTKKSVIEGRRREHLSQRGVTFWMTGFFTEQDTVPCYNNESDIQLCFVTYKQAERITLINCVKMQLIDSQYIGTHPLFHLIKEQNL